MLKCSIFTTPLRTRPANAIIVMSFYTRLEGLHNFDIHFTSTLSMNWKFLVNANSDS